MDRGVKPSAALRQVVRELADYERTHTGPIPAAPFDIGTDQPVRERVI